MFSIKAKLIAAATLFCVVAVGLSLWKAYRKGGEHEQEKVVVEDAKAIVDAQPKQEKREANHARRIETIARGGLTPADVSRMLSEVPAENSATRAAIEAAR